jgi:hypothetical protein
MAQKLHHLEIHFAPKQGGKFNGATVEHHFEMERSGKSNAFMAHPPMERHPFGPGQHEEYINHIANVSGIEPPNTREEHAGEEAFAPKE